MVLIGQVLMCAVYFAVLLLCPCFLFLSFYWFFFSRCSSGGGVHGRRAQDACARHGVHCRRCAPDDLQPVILFSVHACRMLPVILAQPCFAVMHANNSFLPLVATCLASRFLSSCLLPLASSSCRCFIPPKRASGRWRTTEIIDTKNYLQANLLRRGHRVELVQKVYNTPHSVMHGHILAAQAMPLPMDKEIAEDIALLRAQQKIVNDAESKLASAYGNKPLAAPRGVSRMQAAQFQGIPEGRAPTGQLMMPPSDDDLGGDPRPAAQPWVEGGSPERGYEVARYASKNGPRDLAEVDGDKVADWNDFFNNMNARVPSSYSLFPPASLIYSSFKYNYTHIYLQSVNML